MTTSPTNGSCKVGEYIDVTHEWDTILSKIVPHTSVALWLRNTGLRKKSLARNPNFKLRKQRS